MTGSEAAAILDLLGYAGALKQLPRTGWVHIDVAAPESVADHSYRVALMTLLVASADPQLDLARALTIALVHDLPEAIVGDITPFDEALAAEGVDRVALFNSHPAYSTEADRAKHHAEAAALDEMTGALPGRLAELIRAAWLEYEAGSSAEARLVRQIDKLEALLQGYEYRRAQPELPIASFEAGTRAAVSHPALLTLLSTMGTRFGHSTDGESEQGGRCDR